MTRRRPISDARVWVASFVVIAALGGLWAFAAPLMAAPDEPAQTVRAAAVVRGQWRGTETVVRQTDEHVQNIVKDEVQLPRGYGELDGARLCYGFYPLITADCATAIPSDDTVGPAVTYVGRYPPPYHLLVGWPSLVLGAPRAIRAMRLLSAALAAAFVATAIVGARHVGRGRATLVGVLLSVTPEVLFLAGSVNPSALEIPAALAAWTTVVALVTGTGAPRRALVIGATASLGALAWSRPLSPLFVVLVLATVWVFAGTRARARELWGSRSIRVGGLVAGVLLVGSAAWAVTSQALSSGAGFPSTVASNGELVRYSLDELPYRTRQMVGVFGWLDTELSPTAIAVWLLLAAALVGLGLVVGRGRERLAIVGLFVGTLVLVTAAEVIGARTVGTGWQGRYSLPLVIGLPLLAGAAVDRSARLQAVLARPEGWSTRAAAAVRLAATATVVVVTAVQLVALSTSVRRYAVGIDHPLLSYLGSSAWSPPGGQWPLFLASLVIVAAYAALWLVLLRAPPPGSEPAPRPTEQVPGTLRG